MTNEASAAIPMILPLHILAGALALVFGYTALWATKGAALHSKSGMLFVYAMLTMSLTGAWIAFVNNTSTSVIAGSLTLNRCCGNAVCDGSNCACLPGRYRLDEPRKTRRDTDVHLLDDWIACGRKRIVRHLWRMSFGMWVAAASFFWGPPNRIPVLIRIPALLPIPVLTPVIVMLISMWRLRNKKYFLPCEPNRLSSPSL